MEWLRTPLIDILASEEPSAAALLQVKAAFLVKAFAAPSNAFFVLCGFALGLLPLLFLCQSRSKPHASTSVAKDLPPVTLSLLAFTCGLDFFCTDQYQPSMPEMSTDFQVAKGSMSLSIQTHQVCCGFASLLFGPLSDYMGRRKVLLFLQLLLALSTLCCGCAFSYHGFLLGRMMQGASASSMTIILAITRDCYEKEEERLKVGGLLFGSMLIGPLIAPPIGGFLATRFGWRSSFFLLAGAASGIFLCSCFLLQETAPQAPKCSYLQAAWKTLADRRRFLLFLLLALFKSTFSILDNNNAFMLESFFGLPVQDASFMVTVLALAGASGVILSSVLGRKPMEVIRLTMPVAAMVGLCDVLVGIFFLKKLWCYLAAICFQHFVILLMSAFANIEFLQDLEDIAGMAGCVQTAGVFALASLFSLPALLWPPQNGPGHMLCVLATIVFLSVLLTKAIFRVSPDASKALSQSGHVNEESATEGDPKPS
eukprot:Skav233729  [mRNA]  locus=scaffold2225:99712:101160:+ [translate_table: standard]